MMKHIFIALLLTLVSFPGLAMKKAKASEFDQTFVTHEQFVMMSAQDKKLIVIKMMEFMSSAEGRAKIQEVVEKGTPEQKAKWQRIVKVISTLFITEAHAQDPFKKYSSDYQSVLKGSSIHETRRCVYGGWISETRKVDGKTICTHPSNLSQGGKNLVAYKNSANCKAPNKIACNPVIYGFDTGSTPLCADATPIMHNSSLQCMQLALTKGDSTKRLELIAENLANNKEVFHDVMEFIFYSCACSTKDAGNKVIVNEDYQDYMRPHRTCYGLLNQMRTVLSNTKCSPIKTEENFETIVGFLNSLQSKLGGDFEKTAFDMTKNKNTTTGNIKKIAMDGQYSAALDEVYNKDAKTVAFCKEYSKGDDEGGGGETPKDEPSKEEPATGSCKIICKEEKPAEGGGSSATAVDAGKENKDNKEVKDPKGGEQQVSEKKDPVYICHKQVTSKDKDGKDISEEIKIEGSFNSLKDFKEIKHGELACTPPAQPEQGDQDDDPSSNDGDKLKSEISVTSTDDKTTLTIKVKDGAGAEVTEGITYLWYKESDTTKKSLGTAATYEAPRELVETSVCADIKDESGKAIDPNKQCRKVPAKEIKAPPVVPQNGQQGQPGRPPRQQNIHINWGVR